MKIGLALSGGGSRGIVHIGVFKALEENGIVPHIVSGASAGSLAGVLFADGVPTDSMIEFVKGNSLMKMFSLAMPKGGLTNLNNLEKRLKKFIKATTFEELKTPLIVSISNLNTGQVEYVENGELLNVILASCTVPILFKPINIGGSQYVDGGLLANTPVEPLLRKCDFIIAVNLVPRVTVPRDELNSIFDVALRCFDLAALNNINPHLKKSDIVIEPKLLQNYGRFNVKEIDDLFKLGYDETMKMMPDIKHKIYLKSPWDVSKKI